MTAPALTLDFKRDVSLHRSVGIWLLIAGVCAAGAVAMSFGAADKALTQLKQQNAELRRKSAPPPEQASSMDLPQRAAEIKNANHIIRQLNLPWESLFLALEAAASKDVALLSIQPDTHKLNIQINAEARNLDSVLEYLAQLRQQKTLAQVTLTGHEVRAQDPDKPVRFSLSAQWAVKP